MARLLAAVSALLLIPAAIADAKPATVTVMTRNVFLGADLGPGMNAKDLQGLTNGAGAILNQVDRNKFPTRAKGLAKEILGTSPDLVGLQEAALWRTQPCDKFPLPPSATTVRYDYIKLLLKNLKGKYAAAVVKPEFDFEVWANMDGNEQTAGPNCPMGSELNGRLTMRDAILVRKGSGVKLSNKRTGTFDLLRRVKPAGVNVDVTRGWTSVDATKAGHRFRFVNAHLEAFDNSPTGNDTNKDTQVTNGQVREAQAKELVASKGPASGKLPVILVGDLNSDVKTEVKNGDALAYRALLNAKFAERSTSKNGCCLESDVLSGGNTKDFNHRVDHVMTNAPKQITLVRSALTGTKKVNGFWDSDHQGIVSTLTLR